MEVHVRIYSRWQHSKRELVQGGLGLVPWIKAHLHFDSGPGLRRMEILTLPGRLNQTMLFVKRKALFTMANVVSFVV